MIPKLANTATEVLAAALSYDTAGFNLVFDIVGDGEWRFNSLDSKFEKIKWIGTLPVIAKIEGDSFDAWLIDQISRGFVTISIQSPGKKPWFAREIHRATGTKIPYDRRTTIDSQRSN